MAKQGAWLGSSSTTALQAISDFNQPALTLYWNGVREEHTQSQGELLRHEEKKYAVFQLLVIALHFSQVFSLLSTYYSRGHSGHFQTLLNLMPELASQGNTVVRSRPH